MMGILRKLWRRVFPCPTLTPVGFGIAPMFSDVGRIIMEHRPDLYEEYLRRWHGSAVDFGKFLDRHFPICGERWGNIGVGEIAPSLKAYLGVKRPHEVDNYLREQMSAIAKVRRG